MYVGALAELHAKAFALDKDKDTDKGTGLGQEQPPRPLTFKLKTKCVFRAKFSWARPSVPNAHVEKCINMYFGVSVCGVGGGSEGSEGWSRG